MDSNLSVLASEEYIPLVFASETEIQKVVLVEDSQAGILMEESQEGILLGEIQWMNLLRKNVEK